MKKSFIVLSTVAFLALVPILSASPSFYLQAKGATILDATALSQAAAGLGLTLTPLSGTPADGANTFTFNVVGGAIDAGTLLYEIVHQGGFSLTNGTNTVTFNSPVINTILAQPVLTMLVTVNGDLQGRFEVANIQAPALDRTVISGTRVKIKGLAITLTAGSASVLNQTFGTSAFSAGQTVATAKGKIFAGNQLP